MKSAGDKLDSNLLALKVYRKKKSHKLIKRTKYRNIAANPRNKFALKNVRLK